MISLHYDLNNLYKNLHNVSNMVHYIKGYLNVKITVNWVCSCGRYERNSRIKKMLSGWKTYTIKEREEGGCICI